MKPINQKIIFAAFILISNFIFVCKVFCIEKPEIQFNRNYDHFVTGAGMAWVYAEDVEQTTDGGYIITGTLENPSGGSGDGYLLKTFDNGLKNWAYNYNLTGGEIVKAVQQTSDDGYIYAGYKGSSVYLSKVRDDGYWEWARTDLGLGSCYGNDVLQTDDGVYLVVGHQYQWGIYLMKSNINPWLDPEWEKVIQGGGKGYSVKKTEDGGYIIGGERGGNVNLVKTDEDGDVIFDRTYGGA